MDAETILEIKPALTQYLHEFDDCFGRCTTRRHLDTYILGQLSDLRRKSVEPIADAAGVPPRTLQEFLSLFRWDEERLRDKLQQRIARRHGHVHSTGILDETSFAKKGDKTVGVQRQHCGSVGKTENCVVTVHVGYATPDFHTLLDGELYLPEKTWHDDRDRCRAAGIPDDIVYRPKWQIGLEQIRRAVGNGIRFTWMTFDEGYGGKPPFLRELDALGQNYVGEIPKDFRVWTKAPAVLYRRHANQRRTGRPRKLPRLKAKNNPMVTVQNVLRHSPILRRQPWETYRVKEGTKGPMVWRAKRIRVWLKNADGLPTRPHHLVMAYNVLHPEEVKFFLSNAPADTPLETLLLVAFSRWKIERMFEDSKGRLGLDHFEVRRYVSLRRHLILSCVSHLFLAEFLLANRGEKSAPDGAPTADSHGLPGSPLVRWRPLLPSESRVHQFATDTHPAPQRKRRTKPPQTHATPAARHRSVSERSTHLSLEAFVAL